VLPGANIQDRVAAVLHGRSRGIGAVEPRKPLAGAALPAMPIPASGARVNP